MRRSRGLRNSPGRCEGPPSRVGKPHPVGLSTSDCIGPRGTICVLRARRDTPCYPCRVVSPRGRRDCVPNRLRRATMMNTLKKLWQDDQGSVIAAEYLALAGIVPMGGVAGLDAVRSATV